jgi:hypothetical protein
MSILALVLGVLSCVPSGTVQPLGDAERSLVEAFRRRVDAYVELHRKLEGPVPPLEVTSDPQKIVASSESLARQIRSARRTARQGEIFTPDVASLFRRRIRQALKGHDVRAILESIEEGSDPALANVKPRVNGSVPGGAPPSTVPPAVLEVLPELPEELVYRIRHRDLLIWDMHARLIVDFIPNALPAR